MAYRNYSTANGFIVSQDGTGDFSTISAALTAASSGDTIFIRPGTYTENLTLKAGVNLSAFECDSSLNGTGKVIISGTCTLTAAGSVTISGIQLQTNSAALLAVTGTLASIVNLKNCYLNMTNNTGITFSTSSASGAINLQDCNGDLGTTGIGVFAHSSAGTLTFQTSFFTNSGGSSTASTISAGIVIVRQSRLTNPVTGSSTSQINFTQANINTSAQNVTCVTFGGTGTNTSDFSNYTSGTASAISVSASCTLTITQANVSSSNTNAITGAGTIHYSGITFSSSSTTINVTTQSTTGTLQGSKNTTPTAGFLGERIEGTASGVNIPNNTGTNITSISLTAGVWDITGIANFTTTGIMTILQVGISATSATITGTAGSQNANWNYASGIGSLALTLSIPAFRVVVSSTTTYYLPGVAVFSTGACSANGRLSATRVG
jgi:hypothetical protein